MSIILTNKGVYFDINAPEGHPFPITEIAHALSHICRFNGHTREFYSVAQHSVLVSRLVPEEYALEGLLHDATEAYLGDVSSPLKRMLPDYKAIERRVESAICGLYGLPTEMSHEVKRADILALLIEKRDLLPAVPNDFAWPSTDSALPARRIIVEPSGWACRKFIERYHEILGSY